MTADLAARAARHYTRRLGWALAPIPPGSKRPASPGWQRRERCIADADAAFRFWAARPEYGMGVVHAWSGTCALDMDAPRAHVARALAAAGVDLAALEASPGPRLIGDPAKPPKLLYRVPAGAGLRWRALHWPDPEAPADPARRRVVFELRAGPVQDVLPPSVHPGTGEPYRWAGTGCPRTPEDVPPLPPELLRLWAGWPAAVPAMRAACPWAPAVPAPAATAAPARCAQPRPGIIQAYNARIRVADILGRNGYVPARDGRRWTCPGSTSGVPGVVLLDDGRVYSHHASDPLAGEHAHDAFSLLCVLEHGGDVRAAVRAAAAELGLPPPSAARLRLGRARIRQWAGAPEAA